MIEKERLISEIASRHGLMTQDRWGALLSDALAQAREGLTDTSTSRPDAEWISSGLVDSVAGRLTVGETFFMRHHSQISHVADHVMKVLRSKTLGPVRVLSAGCSTGEEPYSLAASLSVALPPDQLERIEIEGVDLNPEAIDKARTALYGKWSFRGTPAWLLADFFETSDDLQYRLRECIRKRVRFCHGSILNTVSRIPAGSLDVILFRNVGIYLREDHLNQVFDGIANALGPDGLLVVAPSDPRPSLKVFARTPHESTAVYRPLTAIEREGRPGLMPKKLPARRAQERRKRPPPARLRDEIRPKPHSPASLKVVEDRGRIMALANRGDWREALRLADRLVNDDLSSSSAFFLRGQMHLAGERTEDPELAVEDLRRAVFLDPSDPIARYWYAHALVGVGRNKKALAQILAMTALVVQVDSDAYLELHEMTRAELLDAAEFMKESLQ